MFDFSDTEACYQSEPYDGAEGYFEPYTIDERADYILAKGCRFRKEDVGKYVVIQNSRRNRKVMPTMYLVNRNITKSWWWSPDSQYAMVFDKKSSAEYQAKRYKYNKARAIEIRPWMADEKWFDEMYN